MNAELFLGIAVCMIAIMFIVIDSKINGVIDKLNELMDYTQYGGVEPLKEEETAEGEDKPDDTGE